MSIYEFVPIENEGMSVISATVFFFSGVIAILILNWTINKFKEQDNRIAKHDNCVDELRNDLADGRVQFEKVKGSIEQTQIVVDRIDQSLSDIARTNTKVIESYLRKGD